jgi:ligand-binding sensor domain-containing protein/serine phosphatase RsbU (regulator of sigma subunit)
LELFNNKLFKVSRLKFGGVMILRRAIFVCFLSSFIINAHAQTTINFHHISAEEGLSQGSVTCILQDDKGFMWFGTMDGLNRYDGYSIKVFKFNPSDSTSILNNFIVGLYEDNSGNMYVETQGGFQKYDPLKENFKIFDKNKLNFKDVRFNTVNAFFVDTTGIQWSGELSTPSGLKRTDTTGKVKIYKHDASDASSLSDDRVFSVYRDRSGNLWVGTYSGLDKLNEKTGKFTHYVNKSGDPNSLSDNWVWSILEDKQGNLWVGTARGGLNRFDRKTGIFTSFKNDPLNASSISDNWIFSIYQDNSGILWMGTYTGGVSYFLPSVQVFTIYRARPGDKNWFSDNTIQSMCVASNGIYWIGTHNDGIYRFDYKENKFKNYPYNPSSSNSISSNRVQSMCVDKSGILWVGNFSGGLDALDPQTNTVKHFKNNPADSNSISDNRIYSVIQGKKGNIWIATYGGGLNELDPNSGKMTRFRHDDNNPNSISSDRVYSVAEDHSGILWLGMPGDGGINSLDPVSKKVTRYINVPGDPHSLMSNDVMVVYVDSKDNIWAGTTQGLSEFDRKTKKFTNYREKDGLPNENVWGILEDNQGFLWISTNKGLARLNPETKTFKNFYVQDGLQGNEFNQGAFAKDNNTGWLLFGGNNGFNIFDPSKIKNNNFMPPVVFTDYIRYNTDNKGGEPIIENGISERDSLKLTYKDNIIKLNFAALNYYNTSENQYKYKLEGLNNNWIQLGNNNSVTFTNLSPGDYTLRVAGSNNDGVWNDKGASLFIEVTPPWWKTRTAYAIYFILVLGILYLARRIELNRREQKAKIRENELQLKATEAEKRAIQAENDRKTKELEEARELQLSMLPKDLPDLPNLEVAAFMRTATEVGGDYYDFIVRDGGLLNVAFGDATGHGLRAGTMVTLIKGFFTSYAANLEPVEFMSSCTAMLKEVNLGKLLMSFSFLKIKDHKLEITSAGMPPLYYFNGRTKEIEEVIIQGMPLGAMKKFPYSKVEKDLNSGDILLLMTDGLPEQMNDKEEMFDYPQVNAQFKNLVNEEPEPKAIIEKFVKLADNWMGGVAQADDITLVAIKIK